MISREDMNNEIYNFINRMADVGDELSNTINLIQSQVNIDNSFPMKNELEECKNTAFYIRNDILSIADQTVN